MTHRTLLFLFLLAPAVMGGEANRLEPILAQPGEVFLKMNFDEDFNVGADHASFRAINGTRWAAKNGVLVGTESSAEFQAEKKAAGDGHNGTNAQLQVKGSPRDFIFKYSFKITGGRKAKGSPMMESGHHLRYIHFGAEGTSILTGRERKLIAKSDFVLELDQWYHVMIEVKGDEFLVRFQDGPTIYGRDPSIAADCPTKYDIRFTATDKGVITIDNMTIWNAGETTDGWPAAREALLKK